MASPGKIRAMKRQNARRRLTGEAFSAQPYISAVNNLALYFRGGQGPRRLAKDEPSRQMRKDLKRVGC